MERTIEAVAFEATRGRTEGVRICEMLDGRYLNAMELSIDEALDLAADIQDEVANFRRGRIVDGLAWCCVCGKHTVPVGSGIDTCDACGREA